MNSGAYDKVSQFPIEWTGASAGTKSFAVIEWGLRGGGDEGIFWIVDNIPPSVTNLAENAATIGLVGMNDQAKPEYIPPCGGGPGNYKRNVTVYALSTEPNVPKDPTQVDASILRAAMKDITLDTATFTIYYGI